MVNSLMDEYIKKSDIGLTDFEIILCKGSYKEALFMLFDKIEHIPAADVRPVALGKWLDDWETGCSECSVCHDSFLWEDFKGVADWNYCPNCGAMMEGE